MVNIVEYTYYQETYGGSLTQKEFAQALPFAIDQLMQMIVGDLTDPAPDSVQRALCYLIDAVESDIIDSGFTSEHLGDYSYTIDKEGQSAKNSRRVNMATRLLIQSGYYIGRQKVCTRY